MRTSPRLHVAIAAACALLLSPTASADWKRDYDRGVKAVEDGNWSEAESLMRSALAEEPRAEARKRFQGTVWKPYLPHFYAGLAASRLGRCEQALQYWRDRSGLAAIAELGELSAQQGAGVAECTRRLAATATPAASTASTTSVTPPLSPSSTASTTTPRSPATSPPSSPPSSTTTRPPASSVASTSSPPPSTTRPTPTPAKPTPAPTLLVDAVESYLGGRYDAVARLDPASLADGRSRAQAFLLRAAARYTLAELNGDARTRQQAQQDVRAARAANASLAPDAVMFSPRFRDFWKQSQ